MRGLYPSDESDTFLFQVTGNGRMNILALKVCSSAELLVVLGRLEVLPAGRALWILGEFGVLLVVGLGRVAGPGAAEHLDEFGVEGGEVVGLAAGDEVAVFDHFLVVPVGSGVAEVGAERGPGRQLAVADHVGFDQGPGGVADGADGLVRGEEGLAEGDGVEAELVGVHGVVGEDVVDVRVGVGEFDVDVNFLAPVGLVPGADLAGLSCRTRGRRLRRWRGVFEGLFGVGELDFFDVLGGQDGDALAGEGALPGLGVVGAEDAHDGDSLAKGVAVWLIIRFGRGGSALSG